MRPRDPRRLLGAGRTRALARVRILEQPESDSSPDGSVASRQVAELALPRVELDRIWDPEHLERLARTYWAYLTRISLGLLRVAYGSSSREVVLVGHPLVLLRFHAPEYETRADFGSVTWRIDRGVLVARRGRGHGFLRISVERRDEVGSADAIARVSSEVANFYPMIAGVGASGTSRFARLRRWLYRETQLRVHVIVANGFLRSLARLDLEPSVVRALAAPR